MSLLPPAESSPPSANPADVPVAEPGFEVLVQAFWEKNRSLILFGCAAALLAIVGREGWQYVSAMREKGVQQEYAKVADRADKLAAFADAHAGHVLAGVAYLQLADQRFEAADYKQAAAFYVKATGNLKNESLLGRARLGNAISLLEGGDQLAGEAALQALGADATVLKAVRAEAIYHLASLAFDAGKTDEVKKFVEEVTKIDLAGAWSQRATALLANLAADDSPADPAGVIKFKTDGK